MALNCELPSLPTPSLATRSIRPSSVQIALVSFFCCLFFFLKKRTRVFVVESRYFKNTSKGYNQVMKMLNIIKDNTKIFTKIFTKAILKIIDLHTEQHTV